MATTSEAPKKQQPPKEPKGDPFWRYSQAPKLPSEVVDRMRPLGWDGQTNF